MNDAQRAQLAKLEGNLRAINRQYHSDDIEEVADQLAILYLPIKVAKETKTWKAGSRG